MGGVSMAPMAETSAIVLPEMPEKKYSASTTDMPRPPRTQPIIARARSTSAYDIPQRSMRLPAKTKVGIASRTQLCEPVTRLDGSFCSEKLPASSPAKPAMPSENTMGSERIVRIRKVTPTVATSMRSVTPGLAHRAALPRLDQRGQTVDDDQHAADHRREIQPAEIQVERGRERLAVQL